MYSIVKNFWFGNLSWISKNDFFSLFFCPSGFWRQMLAVLCLGNLAIQKSLQLLELVKIYHVVDVDIYAHDFFAETWSAPCGSWRHWVIVFLCIHPSGRPLGKPPVAASNFTTICNVDFWIFSRHILCVTFSEKFPSSSKKVLFGTCRFF